MPESGLHLVVVYPYFSCANICNALRLEGSRDARLMGLGIANAEAMILDMKLTPPENP